MLFFLANRRKAIAWFCTSLIYFELALSPVIARASGPRSYPLSAVKPEGSDLSWIGKLRQLPEYSSGSEVNFKLDSLLGRLEANRPIKEVAPEIGGPGQPEMSEFTSVNSGNMVDLFSGDFSYSIPLLDVGGYPMTLGYRAGSSMDDEASWVGLGWNLNPGAITRNMRGLPDDFNGDIVKKTLHIKENKTVGVTAGGDLEIVGFPKLVKGVNSDSVSIGASLGIVYNNYKGWGLERSINASINAAAPGVGSMNAGLSLTSSSMDGLTIAPHISYSGSTKATKDANEKSHSGSLTLSSSYNSRSGLKSLQLSTGYSKSWKDTRNTGKSYHSRDASGSLGVSLLSFYSQPVMPSIEFPTTSYQVSFTAKVGVALKTIHPNFFISGYQSVQSIEAEDTLQQLPSYGYLNFQEAGGSLGALLDYNRERELPYTEKPAYPHIAVPSYTYDAFSMSGEGNGGMFRAYRGDIGYVYDHLMRTKDKSGRLSIDLGVPDLVHAGADLNLNRSISHSNAWLDANPLSGLINFRKDSGFFQAAYFRNPGEKAINSKKFYETLGGDDLVTAQLYQSSKKSAVIQTTNYLDIYKNQRVVGSNLLTPQNVTRQERDRRTQVITFLTAKDAEAGALCKYIENFTPNLFEATTCNEIPKTVEGNGQGLIVDFWTNWKRNGEPTIRDGEFLTGHDLISENVGRKRLYLPPGNIPYEFWLNNGTRVYYPMNDLSYRWHGRLRAPKTGTYKFSSLSDDGTALRLNDKWLWQDPGTRNTEMPPKEASVNLVEGEFYDMEAWMNEQEGEQYYHLHWMPPGQSAFTEIPRDFMYGFAVDTFGFKSATNPNLNFLVKEKRRNAIRKDHHISEVSVLNPDGRRYVYGIPVYNLNQKDYTFAVNGRAKGNDTTGLVKYQDGVDNTHSNQQGQDWYYSKEEMPAYAHSFLLTGILSSDYSDITGNGITDDDLGDAVKFNYSRIYGPKNPFQWRTPSIGGDSASFNPGKLTDYRDDKGSYVYGEKELWYLHSVESKTMIATFVLEDRADLFSRNERGDKVPNTAGKRLKEINLYNKSDFATNPGKAKPVKTVHFEYSYELCPGIDGPGTGKLTLKKISFTYNGVKKNQNVQNPYVFFYNKSNPSYNLKSYDRWGNYKDPLQNPGSNTTNLISNMEYPYSLQDSATAARNAAAWNLDSIYLPSGGSLKVDYEADDYAWVQNKRAMQLFKIVGLSKDTNAIPNNSGKLYDRDASMLSDNRFVFIKVPRAVKSKEDVYNYYLANHQKLYFRLYVEMPADQYDNGKHFEYIPCYAELETNRGYGFINPNVIWVKIKGISLTGAFEGFNSPLVKAATQYIRLNHPSKAFPGSETGDAVSVDDAVKMVLAMAPQMLQIFSSFDRTARNKGFGMFIDTSRSFVRLTNPWLKKYGGGHRVKRITIYDNWDKMTNQRAAKYGQEYSYTDIKEVGGANMLVSSGVANYEPSLGADENPYKQPIEYTESVSALAPVNLGYSEEPVGESFFPSPGVGYSNVKIRTINYKNKKSANGFTETRFYTAYDFPVFTERTLLDINTKKRYKSPLSSFLRINARHYLTMSQGFKVELNDMHGKMRSQASYAENSGDTIGYTSLTEYFYKSKQRNSGELELLNTVTTINERGEIDTAAVIGKDVELMMDMREHKSDVNGYNFNVNLDMFSVPGLPPYWLIPSLINMIQSEKTLNRSVATSKVINRYGILDKVTVIDKGSKVTTQNLLYDSETGDAILTSTQNEFNDPVYNLSYPSHWAYDGMGMAYRNVDVRAEHITFRDGKIENPTATITQLFTSGDEILVYGKQQTGGGTCAEEIATFPNATRIWCIDSSMIKAGAKGLFFIDRTGRPFGGFDVSVRVLRSGRRNMFGAVGEVITLENPVRKNAVSGKYELIVDDASKVIAASGNEFKQIWKVEDVFMRDKVFDCLPNYEGTGNLRCVKDNNGVNTGQQEKEVVDVNKYSGTVGQSKWINIGYNCAECRKGPVWYVTGIKRCIRDKFGRYTGQVEREERDTSSCGPDNAQSRWIAEGKNCAICPTSTTPLWKPTGFSRCEKDAYGYNTGYIENEERDSSSCSAGTVRWVRSSLQCSTCPGKASWMPVGSPTCKSGDCNLKYGSQLVQDTNPCSDSFGVKKEIKVWMDCAPSCDSMKTFVQDFRNTRQQEYGITVNGTSQESEKFSFRDITNNGFASLPEFVRVRSGAACNSLGFKFLNGKSLCTSAGYSVEMRIRIMKDLPVAGLFNIAVGGGSINFVRYPDPFVCNGRNMPAGIYLSGAGKVGGDTSLYGYDFGSRGFDLLNVDEDPDGLLNWRNVRFKIMPTRYYIYYNGRLVIDLPRNNSNGLSNLSEFSFNCNNRHGAIDWMKLRDANEQVKYFEDFDDAMNPKLPAAGSICATPPANCETAFEQFYNQKKGTNYTFKQIDSIFYKNCGSGLNACGNNDSLLNLLDTYEQERRNSYGVTTTYNISDSVVMNIKDIASGGYLSLSEVYRARPDTIFHPVRIKLNNGNFCWDNGYTIEARMKFQKQIPNGKALRINGGNFNVRFVKSSRGMYLDSAWDNQGKKRVFVNGATDSLHAQLDTLSNTDWFTVKMVVTPSREYFYMNNRLAWDTSRNSGTLTNFSEFSIDPAGKELVVDFVKMYDAAGKLKYQEDYSNPDRPALPDRNAICPAAAPDCQLAFVNYFNQKKGTSLTYKQIDSLYYRYTCRSIDVCDLKDTITNIIRRFNISVNPYRVFFAQQDNALPVGSKYQYLTDPELMISDGVFKRPDTLRAIDARWWKYHHIRSMGGNVKAGNGYTIEARVKTLKLYNKGTHEDLWYADQNMSFVSGARSVPSFYGYNLVKITSWVDPNTSVTVFDGVIKVDTNPWLLSTNWVTVKYEVTKARARLFIDKKMVFDIQKPSLNLNNNSVWSFNFLDNQGAVDYFRVLDENKRVIFHENFDDPYSPASIRASDLVSPPAISCLQSFTNYFNQQYNSNYTTGQIDSIYYSIFGKHLPVCGETSGTPPTSAIRDLQPQKISPIENRAPIPADNRLAYLRRDTEIVNPLKQEGKQ